MEEKAMVKINSLELENIKRVKAVRLEPSQSGLTVIGGKNGQGKTSVLDAIAWVLGGDKFKPSTPERDGSVVAPDLKVTLSNGLVVERKGKNSSLKVIDPVGNKAGQQLLNEFIETMALNLPKFMSATGKEKANTLLQIIGVGDKLYELETTETQLYNRRTEFGRIADQKKKYANELIRYPEAPANIVSAAELIKQQQEILARNGENERKRQNTDLYNRELAQAQIAFDEAKKRLELAEKNAMTARMSAQDLQDENTEELENNISSIDAINVKVRANHDKEKAEMDAAEYEKQYDQLSGEINSIRQTKIGLLKNANLPLPELSVENGELIYKGYKWDNMSGAEQLKVATAIVRKLNPNCGFVLLDKLEQMDTDTMREFGDWLESEGLQVIATRVSTNKDECSVIIEDGYVKEELAPIVPKWEGGKF